MLALSPSSNSRTVLFTPSKLAENTPCLGWPSTGSSQEGDVVEVDRYMSENKNDYKSVYNKLSGHIINIEMERKRKA